MQIRKPNFQVNTPKLFQSCPDRNHTGYTRASIKKPEFSWAFVPSMKDHNVPWIHEICRLTTMTVAAAALTERSLYREWVAEKHDCFLLEAPGGMLTEQTSFVVAAGKTIKFHRLASSMPLARHGQAQWHGMFSSHCGRAHQATMTLIQRTQSGGHGYIRPRALIRHQRAKPI